MIYIAQWTNTTPNAMCLTILIQLSDDFEIARTFFDVLHLAPIKVIATLCVFCVLLRLA